MNLVSCLRRCHSRNYNGSHPLEKIVNDDIGSWCTRAKQGCCVGEIWPGGIRSVVWDGDRCICGGNKVSD